MNPKFESRYETTDDGQTYWVELNSSDVSYNYPDCGWCLFRTNKEDGCISAIQCVTNCEEHKLTQCLNGGHEDDLYFGYLCKNKIGDVNFVSPDKEWLVRNIYKFRDPEADYTKLATKMLWLAEFATE